MVSVRWAVYVDDDEEPIIKSKWYRALWRVEDELFIAEEQIVIEDALMKIYSDIDEIPSASASAKILDTPRLGITSRHTMVRVVHDKMLCPYMYSAG